MKFNFKIPLIHYKTVSIDYEAKLLRLSLVHQFVFESYNDFKLLPVIIWGYLYTKLVRFGIVNCEPVIKEMIKQN